MPPQLWKSAEMASEERQSSKWLTLLEMKLPMGSALFLPRRRCWRSVLVQKTKAGLQVLAGSSRYEPGRTTYRSMTSHGAEELVRERRKHEPVTIDPLPFPVRTSARSTFPLLTVHLSQQCIVNRIGIEWSWTTWTSPPVTRPLPVRVVNGVPGLKTASFRLGRRSCYAGRRSGNGCSRIDCPLICPSLRGLRRIRGYRHGFRFRVGYRVEREECFGFDRRQVEARVG